MELKPLPIGNQTFRDVVNGRYLYADKTKWIYELIRYPKGVYFLARPRRFGKSLLISFLATIDYRLHIKQEKYYQTIFIPGF